MDILIPSQLFLRVKEKNYGHFAHADKALKRDPLAVYLRLFSLAVDTGIISLPQKELADDVRISVRTLQKAVNSLVGIGYIGVESSPGQPCTYSLLLSDHVLAQIQQCDLIDNPSWYARSRSLKNANPRQACPRRQSPAPVCRQPSPCRMVDQPVLAADELAQARTDAAHSPAPLTPAISPAGASSAEQPQHHMRRGYAPVAHPFYNVFKNNKNQIPPLPPHAQSSTESNTPSGGGGAFSSLSVETEFSALWAAYPVKKARDRAYRIFRDLKHTGELPAQDRLLSVIAAFRAHDDQWRRGYAPYLNTWLSERRWEDQLLQREKDVETKPVPETLSLSVFKQVRKLPSESEKDNIQALCEAFAAIWPEPVNESLLKGFFISHWGASGGWPSLDMLRRRITEYLAVTEKISLFDGLLYIKKGQGDHVEETASRSGEGRLSGLQGGNRKVA